jgi:hypothetical protein
MFAGTAILAALGAMPALGATTVTVQSTDDLYAAGQPVGTLCCNGDKTPANSPILAPITLNAGSYLTFATTGGASHAPAQPVSSTADGDTSFTYNLTPSFGTGISGPTNVHLNGLAGVFLTDAMPSGAAPAQLSGTSFATISPGIGQIFFIGDGLTGTGSGDIQQFFIPTGATRLFLGIIDDGGYYDNHGAIIATISSSATAAVPEPASWALMLGGFGMVGGAVRSRRKTATISLG